MRSSLSPWAALLFAVVCSTASALYLPAQELFQRDSTCATANYTQCGNDLPNNFCCPSADTCLRLAGNTTVVCCPAGADCSILEPIPCDITLENKELHSEATIMTTALNGALSHCGSSMCCPFGFSCNSDGNCAQDANQNAIPIQSSTATATTAKATSTPTSSSASTPASTTKASNTVIPVSSSSSSATAAAGSTASSGGSGSKGPSAGAVAGGVVGGLAGLTLLAVLIYFLLRRKMEKNEAREKKLGLHKSTSSFGNIINHPLTAGSPKGLSKRPIISKPIPQASAGLADRHDFMRSPPPPRPSPGSINSYDTQEHGLRDGSLDLNGLSPPPLQRPAPGGYGKFDMANRGDRVDPPAQMPKARDYDGEDVMPLGRTAYPGSRPTSQRMPSSEVINVQFDDPERLRRISQQTTFTDMIYQMEHADLIARHGGETPPMPKRR